MSSLLYTNPATDVDALAEQYHKVVSDLVAIHAPLVSRTVAAHPPAPWFTPEIAVTRRERHRLERCWRHSKLTIDHEIYVAQKTLVNKMLVQAKANYYGYLIDSQSNNPRQLWSTINSLSGNTKSLVLPDHDDITTLVNDCN